MMGNKINQIPPVNQINQITNAGALKLQSASLQLQKTADTTSGVQFADLQGCSHYRRERCLYCKCPEQRSRDNDVWNGNERKYFYQY